MPDGGIVTLDWDMGEPGQVWMDWCMGEPGQVWMDWCMGEPGQVWMDWCMREPGQVLSESLLFRMGASEMARWGSLAWVWGCGAEGMSLLHRQYLTNHAPPPPTMPVRPPTPCLNTPHNHASTPSTHRALTPCPHTMPPHLAPLIASSAHLASCAAFWKCLE
eukprot:365433-Chlamydomonas_euryale.AAC.2